MNADTSALLGSLAEGLEEINSACQSFERRAQNASAGLQQSLFACEEKQAHLENVWHTATMQLQRVRKLLCCLLKTTNNLLFDCLLRRHPLLRLLHSVPALGPALMNETEASVIISRTQALAGELSAPGPQQGRGSEEGGTPSASVASRSVVGTAPASAGAAGAARDDNDDEFDDDDKDDEGLLGDDDE